MIHLHEISVSLPPGKDSAATILKGVSLHVHEGDWIALVGPNGCGKTTVLKAAAGLLPLDGGTIERHARANDRPVTGAQPKVGLLLQEPDNQFVASSVRNELLLSVAPEVDDAGACARLDDASERFLLGGLLERNPHCLSGGEKQRLALATVWLAEPDVLLLDEPTSYLDRAGRERCLRFVQELNRSGIAVVWATPGDDGVESSSRVVYMDSGEVKFEGSVGDFHAEVERGALSCEMPPGARTSGPSPGERAPVLGRAALSLRNVSFDYGREPVLKDVSLDVYPGECVGITGDNGSGKSTLLSLMSGVLKPVAGKVERASPRERGRQDVFHLFQSPERLFFAETVFEEVAFGLRSLGVAGKDASARVREALSRVGLEPEAFADRLPFSLSFGEMRRLAFAIASALGAHVLILDEPASCLDAAGRRVLGQLVEHALENRCAVVIASHEPGTLSSVATRCIEL